MSEPTDTVEGPVLRKPEVKKTRARKPPHLKVQTYWAGLHQWHITVIKNIAIAERGCGRKCSQNKALRGIIKLGAMRYDEIRCLPEIED